MIRFLMLVALFFGSLQMVGQENVYPLDPAYHRLHEIRPALESIMSLRPDIVSWEMIGHSTNRFEPVYALKISDHPWADEDEEPALLFCGPHQSEEAIGLEIVLHNARRTVELYGSDPLVTRIVDQYELWFVPLVNPEGFYWVSYGFWPLKRKNDSDSNRSGGFDLYDDGVDLNKNYPFNWECDWHYDPSGPYYKGPEPASESENMAMMELYDRERFLTAFFYHSSPTGNFSETIFFPWKWGNRKSEDYHLMLCLGNRIASYLPRDYKDGTYEVHTQDNNRRGYARDYVYHEYNTLAWTIESCGNTPWGEGVIHPGKGMLDRIIDKHEDAFLEFTRLLEDRLASLRFVRASGEPVFGLDVQISGKHTSLKTGKNGYIHLLLDPDIGYRILEPALTGKAIEVLPGKTEIVVPENIRPRTRRSFLPVQAARNPHRLSGAKATAGSYGGSNAFEPYYLQPQTTLAMEFPLENHESYSLYLVRIYGGGPDSLTRLRITIENPLTGEKLQERIVSMNNSKPDHGYYFDDIQACPLMRVTVENLDRFPLKIDRQAGHPFRQSGQRVWVYESHWRHLPGTTPAIELRFEETHSMNKGANDGSGQN